MARNAGGARALSAVAVVVLAVGVSVLVALALQHGKAVPAASESPSTSPTTPSAVTTPTETESPTPTETTAAPVVSEERFLAFNDSQIWRGTAGSCDGDAGTLELSTDDGESWSAAGPRTLARVLGLSSYGQVDAELTATRDGCDPELLRTYSGGDEWETYPSELAGATYVSPDDGRTIVTPGDDVEAPCATPVSARGSRGAVGVICDGAAFALGDGDWSELIDNAIAMDAASGVLVVAHIDEECDGGAAVTRFDGGDSAFVGCFDDVDPSEPAALSVLGADYMLWTGDSLKRL